VQVSTCQNHKYADVTQGKPFGESFWCKLLVKGSGASFWCKLLVQASSASFGYSPTWCLPAAGGYVI